MAPFAVGAYFGLRSVLKGYRRGWASLVANLVLVALAIGMPIRGVADGLTQVAQGQSAYHVVQAKGSARRARSI